MFEVLRLLIPLTLAYRPLFFALMKPFPFLSLVYSLTNDWLPAALVHSTASNNVLGGSLQYRTGDVSGLCWWLISMFKFCIRLGDVLVLARFIVSHSIACRMFVRT